jgi:hypothetical protein
MPILFALAATQGGTEAKGRALRSSVAQLEKDAGINDRKRRKLAKDWMRLAACFGKAANYVSDAFSVLSRDYLPYDYIVSMLALFYFWNGHGPNERQKEQIRKWFWATCFGQRYSGGDFNRCVPSDVKFFKRLTRKQGDQFHYRPTKDSGDVIRTQFAGRTGIGSAIYCLLLQHRPVSITEKGLTEITRLNYAAKGNRKDRHHIFPRTVMRAVGESASRYNSIANICLLTAEENQRIGNRRPRIYFGDTRSEAGYFKAKMRHHLIPSGDGSGIWFRDVKRGFNRFLKQRADLICQTANQEAGMRLFLRDR